MNTVEDPTTGCWLVVGRKANRDGHIQIKRNGRIYYAHRLQYEESQGPIPEGHIIRHSCDRPNCIAEAHLLLGTHEENVADRVSRGRSAFGMGNGRAKLTEEDVRYILRSRCRSAWSVGKELGVDHKTVKKIWSGETWRHIPR